MTGFAGFDEGLAASRPLSRSLGSVEYRGRIVS